MTEDVILNEQSQREWVRELWRNGGPRSMTMFAHECIAAGVFNDQDRARAFFKDARRFVSDSVRAERDEEELPSSGPTGRTDDDGDGIWAQRTLWDYDAYALNVADRAKHGMSELRIAAKLADECEARTGQRPEVPSI